MPQPQLASYCEGSVIAEGPLVFGKIQIQKISFELIIVAGDGVRTVDP